MALDTSMLDLRVHQRIAAGETVEEIAVAYKTSPDAVRQYLAKVDEHGRTIQAPAPPETKAVR